MREGRERKVTVGSLGHGKDTTLSFIGQHLVGLGGTRANEEERGRNRRNKGGTSGAEMREGRGRDEAGKGKE
jgi:hypothetical protein